LAKVLLTFLRNIKCSDSYKTVHVASWNSF